MQESVREVDTLAQGVAMNAVVIMVSTPPSLFSARFSPHTLAPASHLLQNVEGERSPREKLVCLFVLSYSKRPLLVACYFVFFVFGLFACPLKQPFDTTVPRLAIVRTTLSVLRAHFDMFLSVSSSSCVPWCVMLDMCLSPPASHGVSCCCREQRS
jgi:hypothetical protein